MEPGTRMGPYELVGPLGAGGMGEVYRARDSRLGRDVAIKILPPMLATDHEHLQRFEQEARATGVLNHPNLLTVFDFGDHFGKPYIVSELLEGLSLREQFEIGPLPFRTAVDVAKQVAFGLAAAHEKGIVHRDLKPDNLFITREGRVKILDFGLARLTVDDGPADTTARFATSPGVIMGTPGYISPEQLRGHRADVRSDIFALGVILYEMFSGARPFRGDSSAEIMTSILREDPPPMGPSVPPPLQRIIRRCLERNPEDRFQSAKDVAYSVEAAVEPGGMVTPSGGQPVPQVAHPTFRRLTSRRGFIWSARFAPDGSVVYGAAWENEPLEIHASHVGNPESRRVGIPNADVLAISKNGEMAISVDRRFVTGFVTSGTLARVPFLGGAPREICEDVEEADWDPAGEALLVARQVEQDYRLEYPLGRPIYTGTGWLSQPKFSPKGDLIAFLEHRFWGDNGATVSVIDLGGNRKFTSKYWSTTDGLAWTPDGREVIFAGDNGATGRNLIALDLTGKERTVLNAPARLGVHDISPDGKLLINSVAQRRGIEVQGFGGEQAQDLSWLDWSFPTDLTEDGRKLLFEEQLAAGNGIYTIHVRKTDGGPAVRLAEGRARAISPDGKWVLASAMQPKEELILTPTGAGDARSIRCPGLESISWWSYFPDGERILLWGKRTGDAVRLYVRNPDVEELVPISPEGVRMPFAISPDGQRIIGIGASGRIEMFTTDGSLATSKITSVRPGERPIQWRPDGKAIYVYEGQGSRAKVWLIDLESGTREHVRDLSPADPAGVIDIGPVLMPRTGGGIAYGYRRLLMELYLVEGLL